MSKFKIGLSVSTHSHQNTSEERYNIIKNMLESLLLLPNSTYINIVCDGVTEKHLDILKKYPFKIIDKKGNYGISKAKNTGIKDLLENGVDHGFLMDDDMLILREDALKYYSDNITKTDIHHFSYYYLDSKEEVLYNEHKVVKTSMLNGSFISFTKELIESVGYFKILPHKYGHEHTNFTHRCKYKNFCPFFVDVVDSNKYIKLDPTSLEYRGTFNVTQESLQLNAKKSFNHDEISNIEPCIEY